MSEIVGCGDSNCVFGRPKGMATNGGCRCFYDIADPVVRTHVRRNVGLMTAELAALRIENDAMRMDAEKWQAERAELYQEQERLRDKLARARLDAFKEIRNARHA